MCRLDIRMTEDGGDFFQAVALANFIACRRFSEHMGMQAREQHALLPGFVIRLCHHTLQISVHTALVVRRPFARTEDEIIEPVHR